jgi:Predicted transcriptional regulators
MSRLLYPNGYGRSDRIPARHPLRDRRAREPHGLAVKEELEKYYESEIQHGRLYPNLDTLVDEGFIDKGEIDKRTNSYTLTEEGHEVLRQRHQWENQYIEV